MEQETKETVGAHSVCQVSDFSLSFLQKGKMCRAVNHINFEIYPGEMVALIGESGCGKSVTALSLIGLQSEAASVEGSMLFDGRELLELTEKEWKQFRGDRISMIFQEPMTALNPLIRVGKQILENVLLHQKIDKREGKKVVLDILKQVGLPDVERIYQCYPHRLSGGQRQRIVIAMAFVNNPDLLIADEPTTALDVTIQAQIMDLMRKMNQERSTAVLLISHDLGVIRDLCSRVYIMYAGQIVESGTVEEVLQDPIHPYTRGLVAAIPYARKKGVPLSSIPGFVPPLDKRSEKGCPFANRCFACQERCRQETPLLYRHKDRNILCHLTPEELVKEAGKEPVFYG